MNKIEKNIKIVTITIFHMLKNMYDKEISSSEYFSGECYQILKNIPRSFLNNFFLEIEVVSLSTSMHEATHNQTTRDAIRKGYHKYLL